MHLHNHSWRESNPRPLVYHQCSIPELQERGGFVCLFLLEVGDKELESCRIRKCIWSICKRKGSSKDQSWQVSSYLSIAESRSSSPEAHEWALSKFSHQNFDIPLELVASQQQLFLGEANEISAEPWLRSPFNGPKIVHFWWKQKGWVWRSRWRVGVWLGKFLNSSCFEA